MGWDPRQYLQFKGERQRPGFDLLAQVDELPPGPLYELGCGAGIHARAIAARWPERPLSAMDNSPEMLAQAAREPSPIQWTLADIATWSAPAPAALIFSNATLQWLGRHEALFPHLMRQLAGEGVLAVQMPRNFAAPSHVLMRETAEEPRWAGHLHDFLDPVAGATRATLLGREPVAGPEAFYDLLKPLASGGLDLWETEYLHVLEGENAVVEWVRGSALRPVLEALPQSERAAFADAYGAKVRAAYPRRADGKTLLTFRRLFMVARR